MKIQEVKAPSSGDLRATELLAIIYSLGTG
jgi:hypothetical protein